MLALKILSRLACTHYTFVISAWTPVSSVEEVKEIIRKRFDDSVYVGRVSLSDVDFLHIPTFLNNKGVVRPFEILMKLLPLPKYGNLDATPFVTFFFPLFFGIILGDIVYGLILVGLAAFLRWKSSPKDLLHDVATVAIVAGCSTIFFGFLFGEFLGDLGHQLGFKPLTSWLDRGEAIEVTLLIAIGLGVIHIVLGLLLNTYLGFKMRHVKKIFEEFGKILVILGTGMGLSQLFLNLPVIVRHMGFLGAGMGLMVTVFTSGIVGILEIISTFGNILSYSRIMAIGLASAMLAMVANRFIEASPNIIAGIIIGILIHAINFILGVFSPTIDSLRLHYVEFFSKFYLPTGRPFQQFKKDGR